MTALPSPVVPLSSQDMRVTEPWYRYFKANDEAIRSGVTVISTTVNTVIPNKGFTILESPSTHTLASPEPGINKLLVVASLSTTCKINLAATSDSVLSSTSFGTSLSFTSSEDRKTVTLAGLTTSIWMITAAQGTVTLA